MTMFWPKAPLTQSAVATRVNGLSLHLCVPGPHSSRGHPLSRGKPHPTGRGPAQQGQGQPQQRPRPEGKSHPAGRGHAQQGQAPPSRQEPGACLPSPGRPALLAPCEFCPSASASPPPASVPPQSSHAGLENPPEAGKGRPCWVAGPHAAPASCPWEAWLWRARERIPRGGRRHLCLPKTRGADHRSETQLPLQLCQFPVTV